MFKIGKLQTYKVTNIEVSFLLQTT